MPSNDLNYANLSTVQGTQNLKPNTIASATVVAPISFITYIEGSTVIATVTPPIEGQHMLIFIFEDSPGTFATSGNVSQAIVPTQNLPTFLFYNPNTRTYTGCASNLT